MRHALEDILRKGERLYLDRFKGELEKSSYGHYIVIDVDDERYVVASTKLQAITEAKERFGDRLFYTVQIGNLEHPTVNHRQSNLHAWNF